MLRPSILINDNGKNLCKYEIGKVTTHIKDFQAFGTLKRGYKATYDNTFVPFQM